MLVKLLPNQIGLYEEVIRETIEKSMPDYEDSIKVKLFKELLLDTAQAWIYWSDETEALEGVLITQIRDSVAVGGRLFTLVCMYAPNGTEMNSFFKGWPTLQKFGKAHDCEIFDFYTNNEAAIKYARQFHIKQEITYFQIDMTKDKIGG